ncbi:tyrosine-protein phosphatase [Niveibacterium sp.]|uniref:tyrosine-protein phosphatase n=1 Tax=Niveibacterium sp. TaxID=2017444 RepID=UPI0035B0F5C9
MMKHISSWSCLGAVCLSLSLLGGCGSDSSDTPEPAAPVVVSDLPTTQDGTALTLGYKLVDSRVVFFFNEATQKAALDAKKISAITGVSVRGSFNGWTTPTPAAYQMKASATDKGVWYADIPLASVKAPGNSGQPEFQFIVAGTVDGAAGKETYMGVPASVPLGYWFSGNQLLVFAGDDVNAIINNSVVASTVKTIADFNLATTAGREKISNFRAVPGLSKLFRTYHPFKKSRAQYDTENERVAQVNLLMQEHGVKADITLYKDETKSLDAALGETLTPYYQAIVDGGHAYFIPAADYNTVYYASAGEKFGGWIKGAVEFILDPATEAPVSIHCRLGTDRTGVFTAVLAALGGASWDAIRADYQRSNDMGIKEFRDYKILKYSLEQMLGVSDVAAVTDLKAAVSKHFIDGGYLTQAQIDAVVAKLK